MLLQKQGTNRTSVRRYSIKGRGNGSDDRQSWVFSYRLHRELKFALEKYWSGNGATEVLEATAHELRKSHWRMQADAGIKQIPSNDFSLYDHVLDTAVLFGVVPARYGPQSAEVDLATYFAMARGNNSARAMEMTKWFDTNYPLHSSRV